MSADGMTDVDVDAVAPVAARMYVRGEDALAAFQDLRAAIWRLAGTDPWGSDEAGRQLRSRLRGDSDEDGPMGVVLASVEAVFDQFMYLSEQIGTSAITSGLVDEERAANLAQLGNEAEPV